MWREPLDEVEALVPIGAGDGALVIQRRRDGTAVLSRFDAAGRTIRAITTLDLVAWHDRTTDTQWLVQIGGLGGALDLARLCATTPAIEFLWSAALTDRVQAIAFSHGASTGWVTRAVDGVVELWTLAATGALSVRLCLPPDGAEGADWTWSQVNSVDILTDLAQPRRAMRLTTWDEGQERRARSRAAQARDSGSDLVGRIQS